MASALEVKPELPAQVLAHYGDMAGGIGGEFLCLSSSSAPFL
jgi:hypothetical protein